MFSGPYGQWLEDSQEDFRTHPTQVSSFVRNTLNQDDYLLESHRVNMGNKFIKRGQKAENTAQDPMSSFCNTERWGYSSWLNNRALKNISSKSNLYEDISPYNRQQRCSSCGRPRRAR